MNVYTDEYHGGRINYFWSVIARDAPFFIVFPAYFFFFPSMIMEIELLEFLHKGLLFFPPL